MVSPRPSSIVAAPIDPNVLGLDDLWPALVDPAHLRRLLELAREEDLGVGGDVTSIHTIAAGRRGSAVVRSRRSGVVAGLRAVPALLEVFGFRGRMQPLLEDGAACAPGSGVLHLEGDLRGLLGVERTLLNLLSRLSGIATATRRFVDLVAGTRARICDTRKTTPGLRTLEKYAVRCGGGWLHRIGLHDAMLVKDNHIAGLAPQAIAARVAEAAAAARTERPLRFVEVEVDDLDQFQAILALPEGVVDMVLLDNLDPDSLRRAVALRGSRTSPLLEASGGIDLERVRTVADAGVDRISIGALTHSAGILDLGLDIEEH